MLNRIETGTALRRTMPASWAHLGAMHVLIEARDLRAVGEYLCIGDLAPRAARPAVLPDSDADWLALAREQVADCRRMLPYPIGGNLIIAELTANSLQVRNLGAI